QWEVAAAQLGAELLAQQMHLTAPEFCERVVSGVAQLIATEVVRKAFQEQLGRAAWHQQTGAQALLRLALDGDRPAGEDDPGAELGCDIVLRRPLVAIGAPVAAYMPDVARRLHTDLVIPPHADVANAVGAVSGSVVIRRQVLIHPLAEEEILRAHLPDGPRDFERLAEAVTYAQETMPGLLEAEARAAGAGQVEVRMARQDHWAPTHGGGLDLVYLGTELTFTAAGRPRAVRK
ncbi:MAG: hypothetical protein N2439_12800, partial [Anaerolineae bacterium]|nr:hypothetical protein [Anaerolineae bacterium]